MKPQKQNFFTIIITIALIISLAEMLLNPTSFYSLMDQPRTSLTIEAEALDNDNSEDHKKEVYLFSVYMPFSNIQNPFLKIISNKNVPAFIFYDILFKPPRIA